MLIFLNAVTKNSKIVHYTESADPRLKIRI